jgi:hypothetical protein
MFVFNFYRKCIKNISPTHLVGKETSYTFSGKSQCIKIALKYSFIPLWCAFSTIKAGPQYHTDSSNYVTASCALQL